MANLLDHTPFASAGAVALNKEAAEVLIVAVAGRFKLPPAGRNTTDPLPLAEKQKPPPLGDVFSGEPGKSSLVYEGQASLPRLGTDVSVVGRACAPRGRPVKDMLVAVRVGPCHQGAAVIGDRVWRRGVGTPAPSSPVPFAEMPMVYERSFGGACPSRPDDPTAFEGRNPIGRGFFVDNAAALDRPLPNIEQVTQRIESRRDRPAPCGFGPIARHWEPRARYGGTYDQAWLDSRAPLWPSDLNMRFFSAAPEPLQAPGYLTGGEPVVVLGMAPDGDIRTSLPRWRLEAKTITRSRLHRMPLNLDAVIIEPDDGALTLVWRAAIPVEPLGGMGDHEVTAIRAFAEA